MAHLFGRQWTRTELLARVGDVSQLGGARPVRLEDGPEDGVQAVEVRTGSGFAFTVLPGRGMDLGFAEFNGAPLCWRSSTGEVHAGQYDPRGEEWLRGFYGGLMVTSGSRRPAGHRSTRARRCRCTAGPPTFRRATSRSMASGTATTT